jgi:hypothetical protein
MIPAGESYLLVEEGGEGGRIRIATDTIFVRSFNLLGIYHYHMVKHAHCICREIAMQQPVPFCFRTWSDG